jgi:RND family efflux transporter MFP subunit
MLSGVIFSCKSGEQAAAVAVEAEVIPQVRVQQVFEREVEQVETFTATVEAETKNKIAPSMPLRIKSILVEVGDNVKKGQILATLDATNLEQAKLKMKNDSIEFARIDKLFQVGGISKSNWDAMKMASSVSRSNYENLLENTVLRSPINGVVTERNYDAGDMYGGSPVYVVEQISPVKLKVNVSEKLFTQIKKGMDVDVKLDVYGEENFKGKVSLVYPTINPATRTFPVEVTIANANQRVRPGMFARVTFSYGTAHHVVVPDKAVVKQSGSGDKYVYVYNNGTIEFKKVELGRRLGTEYELVGGVASGDNVVTEGHSRVGNGGKADLAK